MLKFGTQMFEPSKIGNWGDAPTVTVCRMAPAASSLKSLPATRSVTQTFAPP